MILPFACAPLVPTMVWIISNLYAMNANDYHITNCLFPRISKLQSRISANKTVSETVAYPRNFASYYPIKGQLGHH